jgi:SAM-dependent methyltransferase
MTGKRIQADAVQAFSLHAGDYDRWFEETEGRMIFESEVRAVRLLMKDLAPPFLEIGVGSGRFAKALGIRYGVEPSDALLQMAIMRGIRAEKAYGEKLPFPAGVFGAVFVLFTLCFVEDPGKVIWEAKRVLRDGGRLIVGIINRESPWGKLYQKKGVEGHPIYRHARFYSPIDVEAMLQTAELKVKAHSSTLYRQPGESYDESARSGFSAEAGFVCILAAKERARIIP